MKHFYTLLLSLALTGTYTAAAQTITAPSNLTKADSAMIAAYNRVQNNKEIITDGPVYEEYSKKLKELDLKRLNSYSYKEHKKLNLIFRKKTGYRGNWADISNDVLGYISENLEFTSFSSYEEAEREWAEVKRAAKKNNDENWEYYAHLFETISVCGADAAGKVMLEIITEYPNLY